MKEIALVYMVAGISSRFGGKIKALAKVGSNDETFLEVSLNQAIPAGFTKIILIVSKQTEKPFREKFGDNYQGISVFYALQEYDAELRDRPWGTLDALCSAKEFLDCPFVVCSGDDLYGEEAFKITVDYLKNNSDNVMVGYKLKNVLSEAGTVNRGIAQVDSENNVIDMDEVLGILRENIKEKGLTEDSLANMLFYGFQKNTVKMFDKILKEFKKKHEGDRKIECFLPIETGNLIKEGKITMKAYPTDYEWIGLTNPEDEFKAREKLKQQSKNE